MKRIPEPELMDAPDQARAYAEADFSEANGLFADWLDRHFRPRPATGRLIDLGCGPGDICLRLADRLPGWSILGIDAGPNMLALAETARAGHRRIEFRLSHLPDASLPRAGFQAVVSNSLLHHLPDPKTLWQSVVDLAAPGAFVQVMDLHRPESEGGARSLVECYAADAPEVLRKDFHNSLLAAWRVDEVAAQLEQARIDWLGLSRPSDRHWIASGFAPE